MSNFIEHAKDLFGEQRSFNEKEREIYRKVTKENSVPFENVFDLLRRKKQAEE